eukprot:CAMPEP_0176247858 /NCGR_PEP_ID=MMETSP0121_2-20121125/33169_1 /TAXON_ID=160619 /ORGANISM="Kryptoperidinium foliaceum, Strain CCMP 1326" /LENGTH=175 /DNA_ID=CAMNT_0017587521 /DNA_START=69 /DNA_END=592 /DNA_ORIENTATION=+
MEITLLPGSGPEVSGEAILSIRAGTVRRQAAISSGRPFRFPKSESKDDMLVKFDILTKIASGYVVLKPDMSSSRKYKVDFSGDSKLACEVEVKPADGSAPAAAPKEEADPGTSTKDAKEYLETKGVLTFVQNVLQVLVKERPEDPFPFMARHFMSGYADMPDSAVAKEAAPAPPA